MNEQKKVFVDQNSESGLTFHPGSKNAKSD